MLPLSKIFSLLLKIFSKPLINYSKKVHLERKKFSHSYLRSFFIFLGNKYHIFETKINRKFLNIETNSNFRIKNLNENDAITKGVEFFYEIILYSILIGVPLYEMNKSSNDSKEKAKNQNNRIKNIEDNLEGVNNKIESESNKMSEKIIEFKSFVENFGHSIKEINEQSEDKADKLRTDIKKILSDTKEMAEEVNQGREHLIKRIEELYQQQNNIIKMIKNKKEQHTKE